MYWTLEGFYDEVAIVTLVVCARYLGRRRGGLVAMLPPPIHRSAGVLTT
jgi:hypothetical protein